MNIILWQHGPKMRSQLNDCISMASFSAIVERLVRSRIVRLMLALSLLIALGAWAFLPHVVYRIAPTAFVNAELVRVTAPIAGRLATSLAGAISSTIQSQST